MKKGYILPLGTIVKAKEGERPVMIAGRAQLFNNKGMIGYFDYALALPTRSHKQRILVF